MDKKDVDEYKRILFEEIQGLIDIPGLDKIIEDVVDRMYKEYCIKRAKGKAYSRIHNIIGHKFTHLTSMDREQFKTMLNFVLGCINEKEDV